MFSPNTLVGVIIGAAVVFLFSGLAINAVTRAAGAIVFEVRRQFREHPGIMDYTERPEYGRVVDICTRDSLRELATPGLLAIFAPIAVGFGLGVGPLAGYLAGAIATGMLMAVFLANSGGAWDNAQEDRRGRALRRQGLRRPRGDRHRRHRRRPVQGHRRPGHQPADQGDEPGLGADRPGHRDVLGRRRRQHRPCGWRSRRSPSLIIVAAVVVTKRRTTTIADTPAVDPVADMSRIDAAQARGDASARLTPPVTTAPTRIPGGGRRSSRRAAREAGPRDCAAGGPGHTSRRPETSTPERRMQQRTTTAAWRWPPC